MPDLAQTFPMHPLRGRVLSELHARPFATVVPPSRILRLGFTTQADRFAQAMTALAARCEGCGLPAPASDARHAKVEFPEGCFQLERHNEFVTYTWILGGTETPFTPAPTSFSVIDWLPAPGLLIVAADVHVLSSAVVPDASAAFQGGAAASEVNDGRAVVATDLRADTQGFVRILVADRGLDPTGAAVLVQALLEIETYRSLALLGLPEALSRGAEVESIERLLPDLMEDVRKTNGVATNQTLLARITALSAEVEAVAAVSSFRFGATRAYSLLLEQRLALLREVPLPFSTTLQSFLGRRFTPAIRTCEAVESRLAALSGKVARVTELLRTRVEVDLEAQNSEQLKQMSNRIQLQIRLQQTVEGLSVVAISYYVAGLMHYVTDPLEHAGWPIRTSIATAVIVPIVAISVIILLWRARRAHT